MTEQTPTLISTEVAPLTEDERKAAIIKQVEYYFSKENLIRDKFLNREILKHPGNLVPLSVLITFKKLQSLSTDIPYIADVLASSNILKISEDKSAVGIERPFVREIGERQFETREDMSTFFKNLLQEHKDSGADLSPENFKTVLALVNLHPKRAEKLGNSPIARIKVAPSKEHADTHCFVLVREDGSEEDFSYIKCIANTYPALDDKKKEKNDRKRKREENEAPKEEYTKGCILNLTVPGADLDITKMKEIFNKYGTVKFVDIGKTDKTEGAEAAPKESGEVYIRYTDPESAKAALEDASCPYTPLRLLEGEEEKTYFEANVFRASGGRGGRGGKRGGRGGKGGRGGRGGFKKSRND